MKGYHQKQRRYHGGLPRKGAPEPKVKKPPILLIDRVTKLEPEVVQDETKE